MILGRGKYDENLRIMKFSKVWRCNYCILYKNSTVLFDKIFRDSGKGETSTEEKTFIYIMDEDKIWIKVRLADIYYFETIKSTHYCEVKMKNGEGKLHADIVALEKSLPSYYFKSRASTLVNLELVQKVDIGRRILYFTNQIFCTYAENKTKELKRRLRLYSYRNYKGGTDERNAKVTI